DIHMTKTPIPGGTVLEIVDKSGDDISVQINFASKTMIVSRNFDTRIVKDPQGLASAKALLDSSPAVQSLQKIANQQELTNTPEAELIRLERAVVGLLSGEAGAVQRHADRVRARNGSSPKAQAGGPKRQGGSSNALGGSRSAISALAMLKGIIA